MANFGVATYTYVCVETEEYMHSFKVKDSLFYITTRVIKIFSQYIDQHTHGN